MKPATWIGLAIIVGSLAFGQQIFVKGLTAYVSFSEARRAGTSSSVQVMGKLDKTSISYSGGKSLNFVIVSDSGDRLPVSFVSDKPANFDQATRVVAIGSYDGKIFQADRLLVKCPSKYQDDGAERGYGRATASAKT